MQPTSSLRRRIRRGSRNIPTGLPLPTRRTPLSKQADSVSVSVARILKPHGLGGELLIRSLSDVPGRFKRGAVFGLEFDEPRPHCSIRELKLTRVRETAPGMFLVGCKDLLDRSTAETLVGGYLTIAERAPLKGKWLFYKDDLIGLTVYDSSERLIGSVIDLIDLPAGDALEIASGQGETTLVPFIRQFVKAVDVNERRMTIAPIDGLIPWLDAPDDH